MKTVRIEIDGIELLCKIKLNQEDNIDQGFNLKEVQLACISTNITSIIDENMICNLIHKELNKDNLKFQNFRDKILSEYNKGNIVFMDFEGLKSCNIDSFLSQPLEGILYDLNRDEVTILTLINDKKWVNDFALTKLLRHLHSKLEKYEKEASTIS